MIELAFRMHQVVVSEILSVEQIVLRLHCFVVEDSILIILEVKMQA